MAQTSTYRACGHEDRLMSVPGIDVRDLGRFLAVLPRMLKCYGQTRAFDWWMDGREFRPILNSEDMASGHK